MGNRNYWQEDEMLIFTYKTAPAHCFWDKTIRIVEVAPAKNFELGEVPRQNNYES